MADRLAAGRAPFTARKTVSVFFLAARRQHIVSFVLPRAANFSSCQIVRRQRAICVANCDNTTKIFIEDQLSSKDERKGAARRALFYILIKNAP